MLVATQRKEGWLRGVLRPPARRRAARALELLEFVGIAGLAHEPAGNLSYGQRKLLELASLLVADPAVLLLDQPAGGVNPTLISHLADRINELNRAGKTFLLVEHNMEFVMNLCHRVTVLNEGRTLLAGRPTRCAQTPRCSTPISGAPSSSPTTEAAARGGVASRARAARRSGGAQRAAERARGGRGLRRRGYPQGVSFDVPEGEITCVVGPNGAGKSTLLAAISGLLRPREGEIRLAASLIGRSPGQILARGSLRSRRRTASSREMTVRENVEMGAFTVNDRRLVAKRLAAVEELYPILRDRARRRRAAFPAASSASSSSLGA